MKCPDCSSAMEEGKAYIRSTALGFLFFGFSAQHCWFKSRQTGKERIVVHNRHGYRSRRIDETVNPHAWYCDECGTTIIKRDI
jgi:hypothetical protein